MGLNFLIQQFFPPVMESDELLMCWRIDNGSALSVQQCALSTAVWGMHCGLGASSQANRLRASCLQRRRGRGGRPEDSGSAAALSSLFALQWFSHQTRLLNQRPPLTKAANYASMRCPPPTLPLSCSHPGFIPLCPVLCCFHCLALTYFSRSRSDGKTQRCIFDLLLESGQLSLGPSEGWRKKTCKGFFVCRW